MSILPFFRSKRLAIDLGTSNCLVWASGEGVVVSEPSVVAVDTISGRVVAVGTEAAEMLGRTNAEVLAQKPLKDGVVADFFVAEAMLAYFMEKVGASGFFRPEVMVCVPTGITQVERRAVLEATVAAGARSAYLIEQPLAAALGAKLPIESAQGLMIVDIGGGSTGAAVVSLGGIVCANTVRVGGQALDEAIANYVRRIHNLVIGERMAEEIKMKIGSAAAFGAKKTLEVRGRDAILGMPKTISVDSYEVSEAMAATLATIVACVKSVLGETPPELASDIIDRGIVLCGGGANLAGFDRLLRQQTNLPVHVAEDPMRCVVYGAGMAIENIDTLRRVLSVR